MLTQQHTTCLVPGLPLRQQPLRINASRTKTPGRWAAWLALPLSISPTSHQPARARLRSSSGLVLWSAGHRSRCGAGLLHLQALLYRSGTPAAHLVSPKVDCQPLVEATAGQEEAEAQPAVAQLSRSRSDAAAAAPTAAAASSGQRSCACPWDECFA